MCWSKKPPATSGLLTTENVILFSWFHDAAGSTSEKNHYNIKRMPINQREVRVIAFMSLSLFLNRVYDYIEATFIIPRNVNVQEVNYAVAHIAFQILTRGYCE